MVTQSSRAAFARNKPAYWMRSGVGPFAPFAASAVSNTAFAGSNEEYQEEKWYRLEPVATILTFGFLLPAVMTSWPAIIWPYLCRQCQELLDGMTEWAKWSTWRILFVAKLHKVLLSKASRKLKEVAMEIMHKHLTPEQRELWRQTLGQLFQSF